ncbi:MAG: SAM-dependent methyltransferase [Burkholderiaceae bacterium]
MDALPEPDAEARQASEDLNARLLARIAGNGGWIGFDRFMAGALYEPGLGYYTGGSRRFGRDGDFVTAPEISPLFGACVAGQCARWFETLGANRIIEFGAGTGQLAAQVLNALARDGITDVDYRIVELSAPLRQLQGHTLETLAPELAPRVGWLERLPDRIEAVVIGNELIDAMPVRLFVLEAGQVLERGVGAAEMGSDTISAEMVSDPISASAISANPFASPFRFIDRPADPDFARRVLDALAASGWAEGGKALGAWDSGYQSELAEQGPAWLVSVGERLVRGAVLLFDYGFPAAEFYHPQRNGGTLACHYRHRVHHDPLILAGLQDLTAHVDFSALARAAEGVGLDCIGFGSQGSFLLGAGLLEQLARSAEAGSPAYLRQAQAVGRLVSEAEMGELFKAIAFSRGGDFDNTAFQRSDRRAALSR